MARPRLAPGDHGTISVTALPDGQQSARCRYRGLDGRVREITVVRATKGAATRELQRRLKIAADRVQSIGDSRMTVAELAELWLTVRSRGTGGKGGAGDAPVGVRPTKRTISPNTLSAYRTAVDRMIVPTFGRLRLEELTSALLDTQLAQLDEVQSTDQGRTVLTQMLGLAVRRGLLSNNPMRDVEPSARARREIHYLEVSRVRLLRAALAADVGAHRRSSTGQRLGGRRPNRDLADVTDFILGTGARINEALAIRVRDLALDQPLPTAHICGTLIEPRRGFTEALHRQSETKSRKDRTVPLPDAVVAMLRERLGNHPDPRPDAPVLSNRDGSWLWAPNIRTRLRKTTVDMPALAGTTPHTLRRSVGSLVAHERGLDAARDLLGHSHPGVTFQHYVGRRPIAPDVRDVLDDFFSGPYDETFMGSKWGVRP